LKKYFLKHEKGVVINELIVIIYEDIEGIMNNLNNNYSQ